MNASPILPPRDPTALQVDPSTKTKPKNLFRLNDWQYLERAIQRLIAGWGRNFGEWQDKIAVHRHIWDQAECVRRLRERCAQFPGGNPEGPVSVRLEKLANAVLCAPSFEDAIDGIYRMLGGAVARSYLDYARTAHPVHDAPTVQLLQEIIVIKEQHRLWLRDYRRRHPHRIDAAYRAAIERELAECDDLNHPLPVEPGDPANPAGVRTDFRLPARAAVPPGSEIQEDIMPYLDADFTRSVETRRLFWAYGYLREMNLADEQLRWIYDGHFMPWEFTHDISRHLWDESRHGDSGHSRLLDFGITTDVIGFTRYEDVPEGPAEPLSPAALYERVFHIGMVAETGHFEVKNEAYRDFKEGGDLESAEMMLFDIIDETTHVQYAHRWLPELARHANLDASDYRKRAVRERAKLQREANARASRELPRDSDNPDFALYRKLLDIMRTRKPLSNASTCGPRSPVPM